LEYGVNATEIIESLVNIMKTMTIKNTTLVGNKGTFTTLHTGESEKRM